MTKQGCVLSEQKGQKIVAFLCSSDLTMAQIAARMNCTKSVVVAVNRKFRVRKINLSSKRSQYQAR
jgi:hypothetical protein